jgi:hypothetical protein
MHDRRRCGFFAVSSAKADSHPESDHPSRPHPDSRNSSRRDNPALLPADNPNPDRPAFLVAMIASGLTKFSVISFQ